MRRLSAILDWLCIALVSASCSPVQLRLHVQPRPVPSRPFEVSRPSAVAGPQTRPSLLKTMGTVAEGAPPHRVVLDRYRVSCHNERLRTAGLALDTANIGQVTESAEMWEKLGTTLRAVRPAVRVAGWRYDSASFSGRRPVRPHDSPASQLRGLPPWSRDAARARCADRRCADSADRVGRRPAAGQAAAASYAGNIFGDPEWEEFALFADAELKVRFRAQAGPRVVGVSFVRQFAGPDGVLLPRRPPLRWRSTTCATAVKYVAIGDPTASIVLAAPSRACQGRGSENGLDVNVAGVTGGLTFPCRSFW